MKALRLIFSSTRYFAAALLFGSLNIVFGTWAIYIPRITGHLNINEGELGFAVFFLALGTLTIIPFVPKLVNLLGLGRALTLAVLIVFLSFIGPFAAPTYFWLCASLYAVGICTGLLDVTMNTMVSEVERRDKVQIMSATHGFFSLGGMIGAGVGTLIKPLLPSALLQIILVAAVLLIANLFFVKNYIHLRVDAQDREEGFKLKNLRPLLGLAVIGFLVMATEGAIVDWSALYLERVALASATVFGLGYAVFNAMMAVGRFLGDKVSADYGSRRILILGCFIAALGFGLVLTAQTWIAIIGFGVVGIGLSVVVPELFRYSGNLVGIATSEGISFVSGIGFLGLLTGPVFLGFLAQTFDLKSSFIALFCFVFLAALMSFSLERK